MAVLKKHGTEIGRWTRTEKRDDRNGNFYDIDTVVTLTDKGTMLIKQTFKNHTDGSSTHSTGWRRWKSGCITDVEAVSKALKDLNGYKPIQHRPNGESVRLHRRFLKNTARR